LLFVPAILVTALLVVSPGWLRTAQAQSWAESGRVRHIVVTLNKSRTLRFDNPFASAVVGAPDVVDALPMSDRVLYIQGKKVGTTNISVFDQSMNLIGVLDVEVAIDTGNLQRKIRSLTGSGIRVRSSNAQIVLGGVTGNAVPAQNFHKLGSTGEFRGPAVPSRHGYDSLRPCFDLRLPFSQPRLART